MLWRRPANPALEPIQLAGQSYKCMCMTNHCPAVGGPDRLCAHKLEEACMVGAAYCLRQRPKAALVSIYGKRRYSGREPQPGTETRLGPSGSEGAVTRPPGFTLGRPGSKTGKRLLARPAPPPVPGSGWSALGDRQQHRGITKPRIRALRNPDLISDLAPPMLKG